MSKSRSAAFASDNAAGVHPEVLDALAAANSGAALGYGDDAWTKRARASLRRHFGAATVPYLVFGGTGANVVALGAVLARHEAVVCGATAHLFNDECGAPESLLGAKLIAVPTDTGKLRPDVVAPHLATATSVHAARAGVVSISQATEWGTVYTVDEVRALAELAHAHDALLHVDGARLANAASFLRTSLAALTFDAGVDIVSFGGTKNGLMMAEAVVFADAELAPHAGHVQKLCAQLPSKMRFIAAQLEALLSGDLWRRSAQHANAMATRLAERIGAIAGARLAAPVESNAVFVALPATMVARLRQRYVVHTWDGVAGVVRLMTSFATTEADIEALVAAATGSQPS